MRDRSTLTAAAGMLAAAASAVRAQGLGDLGPSFAPLPEPPMIERLVFEQPWPIVIAAALVGIVGFVALNRASKLRAGVVVLIAGLVLAAGSAITARLVKTTREHLMDRSDQLVAAAVAGDLHGLDELLGDHARLTMRFLGERDKIQIIVAARGRLREVVSDARVVDAKVSIDASNAARTHIRIRTEGSAPPNSWWRVDWQLEPESVDACNPHGQWRVIRIKPLWILGVDDPAG